MKKNKITLEEFLALKIEFFVEPYIGEEDTDQGFVITSSKLPGIKVFGGTIEEALEEFQEAKIAWFEMKVAIAENIDISTLQDS